MNDSELVYSTDPDQNRKCDYCKKLMSLCKCNEDTKVILSDINVVIRLEKAHRGGKEVTVIDRLPPVESFLKDLAQKLKKRCGSGGTHRISGNSGIVEIQGDKREVVKTELEKMGIRSK